MSSPADNIFEYCDKVRDQFKRFSLGKGRHAPDIRAEVGALRDSNIWSPPPLLQINPSYASSETIADLVEKGELHEGWKKLKKLHYPLHSHQRQAIDTAKRGERGEHYVITAGTGSGKSMGYIIPIVERILASGGGGKGRTKAIICYPMNALVNSQYKELEKYDFASLGITYARYTGPEDEDNRDLVRGNPPDILLTNFMMLEYVLTRNKENEQKILNALRECEFLVMDELHTYRGRQGADIAMLIRRLRLFMGREKQDEFLCIGTSATMVSDDGKDASKEDAEDKSKELVADFSTRLFGRKVKPQNIITETLTRHTNVDKSHKVDSSALRAEVEGDMAKLFASEDAFRNSAAAVWCEFYFGIRFSGQKLVRQPPKSMESAAEQLAKDSGVGQEKCEDFLRRFLTQAATETTGDDKRYFPLRLHQFFSGPGQFLCTIKNPQGERDFSIKGERHNAEGHRFYATHFCRSCEQEFHPVWKRENAFVYRSIEEVGDDNSEEIDFGYITPRVEDMEWTGDGEENDNKLPDGWLGVDRHGELEVKRDYRKHKPREVMIDREGRYENAKDGMPYVFLPGRFRFCPRCGENHQAKGREANRLASLNIEGRSSATTVLLLSLLSHEPQTGDKDKDKAKTLAFSDNRQDAALQSGYFNDFVFTLKLRAGLLRALERAGGELRHDSIAGKVKDALGFTDEEVINDIDRRREFLFNEDNTNMDDIKRNCNLLRDIIGYHLMFDLRRAWRNNNPNLEKLGLLDVDFDGIDQLDDIAKWVDPPEFIHQMSGAHRLELIKMFLAYMLEEKCLNSEYLSAEAKEKTPLIARDNIKSPWFDKDDYEKDREVAKSLTGQPVTGRSSSFYAPGGHLSRLGRQVCPKSKWNAGDSGMLPKQQYEEVFTSVMATLQSRNVVIRQESGNHVAWQINSVFLIWRLKSVVDDGSYFVPLYNSIKEMLSDPVARKDLALLEAREHTAQVNAKKRERYEERFRNDKDEDEGEKKLIRLPVLVCSPTMELGIDISSLNTVYLRNVPPTPANYVQRSGRAGRAGAPALVVSYCAAQSPHDQYYFAQREAMVAGKINAPRLELANRDLLNSHFNAIWLQKTGVAFPNAVAEIMDHLNVSDLPIRDEYKTKLENPEVAEDVKKNITELISDLEEYDLIPPHAEHWLTADYTPPHTYWDALNNALNRWRDIYRTVRAQVVSMSEVTQDLTRTPADRKLALKLLYAATAQEKILVEEKKNDFYSYRFLASQGFLPGYNFPRLPLVAFLPRKNEEMDRLSRPRFLALSEFAPRNLIYHQNSRYRIVRAILRPNQKGGEVGELSTEEMRVCTNCGHGYLSTEDMPDRCRCCNAPMGDADTINTLYEIQDFVARRTDRINSGEEERQRHGYELRTAYRFSNLHDDRICGEAAEMTLDYGQAATVWRVNLGLKRRKKNEGTGFRIDPVTGAWEAAEKKKGGAEEGNENHPYIVPYVKDNRNILIMRWKDELGIDTTTTLRHALKIGMTEVFQIEENELSVEPMPRSSECKAFLYYESVEGGAGVLNRIPAERDLLAKIAKAALSAMHYKLPDSIDPLTLDELMEKHQQDERCKSGCYRCLFSYYNQPEQENINREDAKALSILLELARSEVTLSARAAPPPPAEPAPPKDPWLAAATAAGWRAPDATQHPLNGGIVADYYYKELQAAVFVQGQLTAEQKTMLEGAGYHCVVFPADKDAWQGVFNHQINRRLFT